MDQPKRLSSTLQIMLLLTVLSLAPAILLMTTSFVRIIVVLGLLRQALGTQQLAAEPGHHVARPVHDAARHDADLDRGLQRRASARTPTAKSPLPKKAWNAGVQPAASGS